MTERRQWRSSGLYPKTARMTSVVPSRLLRKVMLTIIALMSLGLTKLIFNMVVIRRFGPELLGNINLSISTALLFSLVASAGLSPAATKYVAEYSGKGDEENSKRSFTIALFLNLVLSITMSLLMFANSGRLAQFMNGQQIWFAKASLVTFSYSFYLLCKSVYYAIDKVETYFKNELFADAIFYLTLFVLVLFNFGPFLIMPFVLLYSVFVLWALWVQRSSISISLCTKLSKTKRNIKEILSFSSIALVGTLSSMGGRYLSTMLTGTYSGAKEVGYYSVALSAIAPFYLLSKGVSMVLFPSMSGYYGKEDRASIGSTLNESTRWLLIISSLVCGIAIVFGRFIFSMATGTDNQTGIIAFQILIIGAYISIIGVPSISTLSGTKYVHIPNIAALLGLALSIISWRMLIPSYGIVGTALGLVVLTATSTSISMCYAQKLFFNKLLKNLKVVLLFGCVLVGSLLFGKYFFSYRSYPQIASGLVFTLIFIVIYKNELYTIGKSVWIEMITKMSKPLMRTVR